jgi:membrane-bound inhibitor of C-type lysozyme
MQTVATLPILQTVNDVTEHYLGLQPATKGSTTAQYVNPSLSFNPSSNTLTLGVNLNLLPGAINTNALGDASVTAPKIRSGAVSSNHIASGIQFNSSRIIETVNVSSIAASGNVNIDVSNATVHYFTANTTANVTFNLRGNSSSMLDSILTNGQSVSVAIGLTQGGTQYQANIYIDGVLQTANTRWMGNTRPNFNVSIGNAFTDFYSITAIKIGANSYAVLAGNTVFGVGA